MDPLSFDRMSRDELVAKGRSLGVERPELMTRVELGDEIVRRTQSDPALQRSARGWLGIARDLVASVVESGLNLPDAAAAIRGDRAELPLKSPAPVATVTLAEIYATQGHLDRALQMLGEVLTREPEHFAAKALRGRLQVQQSRRIESARAEVSGSEAELRAAEVVSAAPRTAPVAVEPTSVAVEPTSVAVEPTSVAVEPTSVAVEPTSVAVEPTSVAVEPTSGLPPSLPLSLLVLRTRGAPPAVCWEVGSLVLPEKGVRLEIACLGISVVGARPERREVTLSVDSLSGKVVLSQFDAGSIVRVALGYRSSGVFVPVAIGSELVLRGDTIDVCFRPPLARSEPLSSDERALVARYST